MQTTQTESVTETAPMAPKLTVLEKLAAAEAELAALPTHGGLLDRRAKINSEIADLEHKNARRLDELGKAVTCMSEKIARDNVNTNMRAARAKIAALKTERDEIDTGLEDVAGTRRSLTNRVQSHKLTVSRCVEDIFRMLNVLIDLYHQACHEAWMEQVRQSNAAHEVLRADRKQRNFEAEKATRPERKAAHKANLRAAREAAANKKAAGAAVVERERQARAAQQAAKDKAAKDKPNRKKGR